MGFLSLTRPKISWRKTHCTKKCVAFLKISEDKTQTNAPKFNAFVAFVFPFPTVESWAVSYLNQKVRGFQTAPFHCLGGGCLHLSEFHHTCGRQTPAQGRSSRMGGQGSSITTHEAWFQPGERRFVPHGWECLDDVNNHEGMCFFWFCLLKKKEPK